MANRLLFYLGDTLIGDLNKYAKNRKLSESLKSETSSQTADSFTFSINWVLFQRFIAKRMDEPARDFLKIGKTRVVFETNGYARFAGWLAARPARSGAGSEQELQLTFYEHFARLSGDLVCSNANPEDPYIRFENRPAHLFVRDLIDSFIDRAEEAGETLYWEFGKVDTLPAITKTYEDFQTIAKALCDRMDNVTGAGKFDVVFRPDPKDYTKILIDILKPRGQKKQIVVRYPGDGIYKLWASDFSVDETNDYASHVLVAGNGQVGSVEDGEQTANLGTAESPEFVKEQCYYRRYITKSNLESQNAVDAAADTELATRSTIQETPTIRCVGLPIEWGNAENLNNGLALGDSFYFSEEVDDLGDDSGWYRIIGMETSWDDNGVEDVTLNLMGVEEE